MVMPLDVVCSVMIWGVVGILFSTPDGDKWSSAEAIGKGMALVAVVGDILGRFAVCLQLMVSCIDTQQ